VINKIMTNRKLKPGNQGSWEYLNSLEGKRIIIIMFSYVLFLKSTNLSIINSMLQNIYSGYYRTCCEFGREGITLTVSCRVDCTSLNYYVV